MRLGESYPLQEITCKKQANHVTVSVNNSTILFHHVIRVAERVSRWYNDVLRFKSIHFYNNVFFLYAVAPSISISIFSCHIIFQINASCMSLYLIVPSVFLPSVPFKLKRDRINELLPIIEQEIKLFKIIKLLKQWEKMAMGINSRSKKKIKHINPLAFKFKL